jgi:hypothetical protein
MNLTVPDEYEGLDKHTKPKQYAGSRHYYPNLYDGFEIKSTQLYVK